MIKKDSGFLLLSRRRLLTAGAAALAAPAILPRSAFAQQAKTIKIGGAVPLSGPVAYWGHSTAQGFIDGAAVINEAGGVMINGEPHMIEVVSYDTKGEVADSRAATMRLVEQDKCKYVFSQAAASNVGMLQVTEPAGVLSIVACWGYLKLFGKEYPLHFRAEMSDYEQGFAYIPFMQEKYGKDALKNFYTQEVMIDSPGGAKLKPIYDMYKAAYPDLAAKPDHPQTYMPYGIPSAMSLVKALQDAGPNPTREKVLAALKTQDFDSGVMAGRIQFGPQQRAANRSTIFIKYDGNTMTPLPGVFTSRWTYQAK